MHDNDQYDRIIDQHQLRAMVLFHPDAHRAFGGTRRVPSTHQARPVSRGMVLFEVLLWVEARKAERDAE